LATSADTKTLTILVAAPDQEILNLVKAILDIGSYRILLAGTVSEALTLAGQHRPDIILAASGGHDMGRLLCRNVRQNEAIAQTPFVVMTTSDRKVYPHYFAEGCDQILPVPFKCAELHAVISNASRRDEQTRDGKIHALCKSGQAVFVDPDGLNQLLNKREVLCFHRSTGLAVIGRDPLRCGRRADYPGPERRNARR